MMRSTLALLLILSAAFVPAFAGPPPASRSAAVAQDYDDQYQISFTSDQLENLLAPVALYPDPLLAQVLLAATFPDQIDEAARTMRAYSNRFDVDSTNWDVSVKAVAHYPAVLSMMADKIDWTTSVGQAYVNQSTDVMDAIQHLRREARSAGNLVTSPQQEIVDTDGYLYIYPANPQYIYVPIYDPAIVYFNRPAFFFGSVISFGAGFAIGAWLNHDCDWGHHRVFYHGWENGPSWVIRSRPFIRINNVYVSPRYHDVVINRRVNDHQVNYGALDRYHAIHRDTDFRGVRHDRGVTGRQVPPVPSQPHPDNKIIRRNINPNDPRIDSYRGRGGFPQGPAQGRGERPKPEIRQLPAQPPAVSPGQPRDDRRGTPNIGFPRNQPQPPGGAQPPPPPLPAQPPAVSPGQPRGDRRGTPNIAVPRNQPQPPGGAQSTPPNSVFRGNAGGIDARDASRRGQFSRESTSNPGTRRTPRQVQNPPPRTQKPPSAGRPQGRPR